MTWVTLGEHVGWFEHSVGDLSDGKLLVVSLLSRDDRSIRGKHEVNSWVWDKIGLELSNIDVKSTIETKGSSKRRNNLTNKSVKIGVSWSLNIKGSSAHIVKGLVIQTESTVSVLKKGMGRKYVVVWLDDGSSDLWSRGDSEGKLRLSTIVNGKSLKKKRTKSRSTSTTGGMEDKETLKTGTVISQLSDSVKDKINNFLTNGVVTTGIVIGSILFTRDQLLRVIKLSVSTSSDFVEWSWLKIKENSSRNAFTGTSFREKGVEGVITTTDGFVRGHLSIRLDTML
jgi:phosphoribosylformylglycinamidine (FGAM) synthase-like amidotransferase family enzyme